MPFEILGNPIMEGYGGLADAAMAGAHQRAQNDYMLKLGELMNQAQQVKQQGDYYRQQGVYQQGDLDYRNQMLAAQRDQGRRDWQMYSDPNTGVAGMYNRVEGPRSWTPLGGNDSSPKYIPVQGRDGQSYMVDPRNPQNPIPIGEQGPQKDQLPVDLAMAMKNAEYWGNLAGKTGLPQHSQMALAANNTFTTLAQKYYGDAFAPPQGSWAPNVTPGKFNWFSPNTPASTNWVNNLTGQSLPYNPTPAPGPTANNVYPFLGTTNAPTASPISPLSGTLPNGRRYSLTPLGQ